MSCAQIKKQELKEKISQCVKKLYHVQCEFDIIRPKNADNGNLAATAALVLGKVLRRPPLEIAGEIAESIQLENGEKAFAAGKGYINFFLKPDFMLSQLKREFDPWEIPLPPLESEEFARVYPVARLAAVLKCQGTPPKKDEKIKLLPQGEGLLWAIFFGSKDETLRLAAKFYDEIGLKNADRAVAAGNYVLLGNAICRLLRKD